MSALHQQTHNPSLAHWVLWVAPTKENMKDIASLDQETKTKNLLLHPKQPSLVMNALIQALESGLYDSIKIAKKQLTQRDQNVLQLRALRAGVAIEWTDSQPSLNQASQLSLI